MEGQVREKPNDLRSRRLGKERPRMTAYALTAGVVGFFGEY